jgi:hypothetical protein
MKFIKKGIPQIIVLDQEGLASNSNVRLSIVGENGAHLKGNSDTDLKDIILTFNINTNKFEIEVVIDAATPVQYIRLYFYGIGVDINANYYPEDAKLEADIGVVSASTEIVPVQYYIDYILAVKSKLDPNYEEAINGYLEDKNGLRSFLKSAQDDLEKDCEIYFTERTLTEERDNNYEEFPSHQWQFQVVYPPINELVSFEIRYGENTVAEVNKSMFVVSKMMGMIEFVPVASGQNAGLYALLLQNISGLGLAILRGGLLNRVPNMFRVTYKTGIWAQADEFEKEGLRKAISRRTFMDSSFIIDPAARAGNASESLDGGSKNITYRTDKILDQLNKDEKEFIKKLQKKYAKQLNSVIV